MNTRGLVIPANCHKSALPHFAGTITPRNWQFAVKWRPNRRSVTRTWFLPCYQAWRRTKTCIWRKILKIRMLMTDFSDRSMWITAFSATYMFWSCIMLGSSNSARITVFTICSNLCLESGSKVIQIPERARQFGVRTSNSKETGHLWLYYIYMTVFIRNAANLAQLLLYSRPQK
jgi:hypothetical protein